MSSTVANGPLAGGPRNKGDVAVDVVKNAAHLAHEARMLQTLAADAFEEGTHAARRTVRRLRRRAEDFAEAPAELAHRVRREPLKAVALALGVGLVAGVAINWSLRRLVGRCEDAR